MKPANPLFDRCPVCSSVNINASGIISYEGELLRCPDCELLLNDCDMDRYIKTNSEWDSEEGTTPKGKAHDRMRQRATRLLNRINKYLGRKPDDISILDIGCSAGDFLLVAQSMGYAVEGVEPSERASMRSRERGISTFTGLLEHAGYDDEKFDLLTMFNVIEHISEPKRMLAEAFRITRPGGLIVIETGNTGSWTMKFQRGKWHFFDMDEHGGHVCFYNPGAMRVLCEGAGFVYEDIQTRNVRILEKKNSHILLYRTVSILHELLQYPSRLLNKGHDMVAFYRKPAK